MGAKASATAHVYDKLSSWVKHTAPPNSWKLIFFEVSFFLPFVEFPAYWQLTGAYNFQTAWDTLMWTALNAIDQQSGTVWAWTADSARVRLYEWYGFELSEETTISEIPIYAMIRKPRDSL